MTASFSTLRAFMEVARLQSFTRAAETLCITQSAVSKQVQVLEHQLGFRLFQRSRRALLLTPAGSAYLSHAADALAMLDEGKAIAQEVAGEKAAGSSVELSASPAFAAHWLVARLPRFLANAPTTKLSLRPRLPDFSPVTERFDMEIRVGGGRWPDARATYLLGREMALVASPGLLAGRRIESPRDLDGLPLLQRAQRGYDWREWSAVAAPDWQHDGPELLFEGFSVLIPAVIAGCGLAICPLFMVLDQLQSGQLVRPLNDCVRARYAYYGVVPAGAGRNSARDRLLDWMLSEAQLTQMRLQSYLDR
ncbi:LysR substrate-binding domain-containing protein [Pigmentiphaga litoralis]|uniref:DNA-binding transcriptional LysR family regulator n=1 Tax=Pigmentiphaga litoralis TaxID=516702 RepID=A0A7Y9ISE5_9BURK|nr:LysR substrate-binding domain-containing protein [Pigmentiphaga litoralis]NYE24269.1 DNA-binding transcriptional LysR family regulator [Pigmentiphaga litoralis]NYE82117.1 DNA-binding transcriptional LysR family regulator [Pigmentiphaga litoralis]